MNPRAMRQTIAGLIALTVLITIPRLVQADPARHVVLFYVTEEPLGEGNTRSLVAYLGPDGQALDWMFDGLLVSSWKLVRRYDNAGHVIGPTDADLANHEQELFDWGQLDALANTVSSLRQELGDPDYRLKIYLSASRSSNVTGPAHVQRLFDRFQALGRDELELAGFYWCYEEGTATSSSGSIMATVGNRVHSLGLEWIWIPYYNSPGSANWKSYKFDRINMQAGYAFSDVSTARFATLDDKRASLAMAGVEYEVAGDYHNPQIPGGSHYEKVLNNANAYLDAADRFNWGVNDLSTYYHGTAINAYWSSGYWRPIYDRLYRNISIRQRQSVAERVRVVATQDTFTERASSRRSVTHGADGYLNLGTNSFPNANRTYVAFEDQALLDERPVLAAHLVFTLDWFPYGSRIDDLSVYKQTDRTWDESTLNGNNEPAASTFEPLGGYRMRKSHPRYSLDVTSEVVALRTAQDARISFMARRDTEDGKLAEAGFFSRESEAQGTGKKATAIELVLGPEGSGELYADELAPMDADDELEEEGIACSVVAPGAGGGARGVGAAGLLCLAGVVGWAGRRGRRPRRGPQG